MCNEYLPNKRAATLQLLRSRCLAGSYDIVPCNAHGLRSTPASCFAILYQEQRKEQWDNVIFTILALSRLTALSTWATRLGWTSAGTCCNIFREYHEPTVFTLSCVNRFFSSNNLIMHILPLPPYGLYSTRAQNGYGQHRPCTIVLLTLVALRGVTDLYISWGTNIEYERTAYHVTFGPE